MDAETRLTALEKLAQYHEENGHRPGDISDTMSRYSGRYIPSRPLPMPKSPSYGGGYRKFSPPPRNMSGSASSPVPAYPSTSPAPSAHANYARPGYSTASPAPRPTAPAATAPRSGARPGFDPSRDYPTTPEEYGMMRKARAYARSNGIEFGRSQEALRNPGAWDFAKNFSKSLVLDKAPSAIYNTLSNIALNSVKGLTQIPAGVASLPALVAGPSAMGKTYDWVNRKLGLEGVQNFLTDASDHYANRYLDDMYISPEDNDASAKYARGIQSAAGMFGEYAIPAPVWGKAMLPMAKAISPVGKAVFKVLPKAVKPAVTIGAPMALAGLGIASAADTTMQNYDRLSPAGNQSGYGNEAQEDASDQEYGDLQPEWLQYYTGQYTVPRP